MAFQIQLSSLFHFHIWNSNHIVFNLVSIHLNLFYILLKSNVATDRFKTQSLFPWNLDNFFLILAGQIQIECKSTNIQSLSSYNRSPELKVIIAVYGICDVFVVTSPAAAAARQWERETNNWDFALQLVLTVKMNCICRNGDKFGR